MQHVKSVLLLNINLQLDANGNIVGFIHPEKLRQELDKLETNDDGCIEFKCDKRRTPHYKYSHMGPTVPLYPARNTPNNNTPVQNSQTKDTVDNW